MKPKLGPFAHRFGDDWIVECEVDGHMYFCAYQIVGVGKCADDAGPYKPHLWRKGGNGNMEDQVEVDTGDAEPYMSGCLKWDGEMEAKMGSAGLWFGDRRESRKLDALLGYIYELGLEYLASGCQEEYFQ